MNKKMMSAIQKLVLTDATFNGETVEPTFINFFYGKNGAGKSTIARTIRGNLPGSVEWQSDRPADSYDVLVYDADFIRDNFENYDNLPGVFTIAEENIAVQKQVKEKNDERKKLLAQIENKLSTIARQGRAFGIHLILATQRPDATIIPGQIRNNMDFRVCGRADSVLSQIILDSTSAAEQIPKDARGRFITGDGIVFQGYLFDERIL